MSPATPLSTPASASPPSPRAALAAALAGRAAARARAIRALAHIGGPDFSTDPSADPTATSADPTATSANPAAAAVPDDRDAPAVLAARDYLARQPAGDRRPGRASLDAVTSSRLGRWLGQLLRFELGRSQRDHRPVSQHLAAALPITLLLILLALTLAYAAALPAGAVVAARPRTLRARVLASSAFLLAALPLFVLASLALRTLASARGLALFPPGGLTAPGSHGLAGIASAAHHLILPALCLAAGAYALASTAQRNAIAAVLAADHTRTARAQGLPERRILVRALREAAPTMCALAAVQLPQLAAGAVIVERVFDLPGLGSLILAAIDSHDEPVLLGAVLTTAVLAALALGLADLARRRLDPRQRVAP